MKELFLSLLLCTGIASFAQNGQLPPVTFTPGQNICDYEPWKLVFYDNFNGTQLNPPWIRFNSWLGMPGGDHEDWQEGRFVLPHNSIQKDENVMVSNGNAKLQMRRELSSWRYN